MLQATAPVRQIGKQLAHHSPPDAGQWPAQGEMQVLALAAGISWGRSERACWRRNPLLGAEGKDNNKEKGNVDGRKHRHVCAAEALILSLTNPASLTATALLFQLPTPLSHLTRAQLQPNAVKPRPLRQTKSRPRHTGTPGTLNGCFLSRLCDTTHPSGGQHNKQADARHTNIPSFRDTKADGSFRGLRPA